MIIAATRIPSVLQPSREVTCRQPEYLQEKRPRRSICRELVGNIEPCLMFVAIRWE
jgi:hypothetical protein